MSEFTVANRLEDARSLRGWTQQTLSERSGVPRAMISRLESGRQKGVTVETVCKLARALRVSVDWLIEKRASNPPVGPTNGGKSATVSAITAVAKTEGRARTVAKSSDTKRQKRGAA